jgi:hypothetical protein
MPDPTPVACPSCGAEVVPPPRGRRKCPECREWVSARPKEPAPAAEADGREAQEEDLRLQVEDEVAQREEPAPPAARFAAYKLFRSRLSPWELLFKQAADFATQLGPGRLISISHSEDQGEALVAVWYWREALDAESPGA